jgi:hypothetical protein
MAGQRRAAGGGEHQRHQQREEGASRGHVELADQRYLIGGRGGTGNRRAVIALSSTSGATTAIVEA